MDHKGPTHLFITTKEDKTSAFKERMPWSWIYPIGGTSIKLTRAARKLRGTPVFHPKLSEKLFHIESQDLIERNKTYCIR